MPAKITCPKCSKELSAPDEAVGKKVSCPRCGDVFRVSPPAPAPGPGSPASKLNLTMDPEPLPAPPPVVTDPVAPPVVASAIPGPPVKRPDGAERPLATGSRPLPATRLRAAPTRIERTTKVAKFIAAEATDARIELGADGQLPNLVLQDSQAKPAAEDGPPKSNPLLLVGVLCFSLTTSVILLFVDFSRLGQSEVAAKAEARLQIEQYYTGRGKAPKPYEKRLREALQAHNIGDYERERSLYREVADMLHSVPRESVAGLTGMRKAQSPPYDTHLEELLSTLFQ